MLEGVSVCAVELTHLFVCFRSIYHISQTTMCVFTVATIHGCFMVSNHPPGV